MKDGFDKKTIDGIDEIETPACEGMGVCMGYYAPVTPPKITGRRYKGTTSPDSTRSDWRTPDELFNYLDLRFGPFEVDLAACELSAKCDLFYSKEVDSLKQDWTAHKNMFMNPPYDNIMPWAIKAVDTISESKKGTKITVVLPNDNSTAWFSKILSGSSRVINIISDGKRTGRISFIDAGTNKPCGGNSKGTNIFVLVSGGNKNVITEYVTAKEMSDYITKSTGLVDNE